MATNFSGKKIPDLLPAVELQDSDLLVVEQAIGTRKTTLGAIRSGDASYLIVGTLPDGRLSPTVQTSLGKADTASQPGHIHAISDITGLSSALSSLTQVNADWDSTSGFSRILNKPTAFPPTSHQHSLTDLTQSGATTGQIIKWNGTQWAPGTDAGLTAGVISVNTRTGDVTLTNTDVGLANVENTALSTWSGSSSITTVGAVTGTSFNSITGLSSTTPIVNGTAAVGTSTTAARADHVHPTDSTRASTSQAMHIGTTQVAINRASANLALTGITSIDGNAATATKLATAVNINGVSFDGSTNITITAADATKLPLAGGTMTGAISFAAGQTWPTFNQSTTGNAATATKLATARTLTLGNTGKTFDGSADVSWSLSDIGAQAVLTSGTNIKTINNQSLLGSGDITISSQGTISVTSNTGLSFSNNTLGTIYNTTMPDTMQSTTAGGATPTPASTWKTRTIVQVLDAILFPTNPPTISTQKGVTLNVSGDSGILEIGTIHNRTLSHVFERGIITNGDGTQGPPLVGAATSSAVYAGGPGITGATTNGALGNLAVLPGTNNWTVTITHAVGTGNYFDNKGNIDTSLNSFRAAGTVSDVTSSPTITGIYPYYWGVSSTQPTTTTIAAAISGGSANRVLADSNGTVSITFGAAAQFIWFAHAEIYTVKTKWYNTDLNQGNIGAGNFILSPLDQAVSANNGSWTNVNYKVYISGGATNTSGAIQFRTA